MDEQDLDVGDPLALSRLDVISCGLGGAVLLGLVFTVVRHQPPAAVSAPPFILVEWRVVSANSTVFPLVNAVIRPPAGAEEFDLPLEEFDLLTGRTKPPQNRSNPGSPIYWTGEYELLGFSRFGDEEQNLVTWTGAVVRDDNASATPVYRLRIANPEPGQWEFRARYHNNRNARNLADEHVSNTIAVTARAFTRESPGVVDEKTTASVGFGETDAGITVYVSPVDNRRSPSPVR